MDAGFMDPEDFLYIMSRSDDVINVAGHRLSTGALEEVRVYARDASMRSPDWMWHIRSINQRTATCKRAVRGLL